MWMQGFTGEYQIDYATFAPSARVQTFTTELDERAAEAIERVVRMFKHGLDRRRIFGPRGTSPQGTWAELKPGDKLTWTIDRPGTIRSFQVALTDRAEPRAIYALHNCVLRIWWDDSQVPDVELPLPAFFGTGFGRNPYNSLPMGTNLGTTMPGQYATEGWFMYNYFPMPFARSARIEIANENERGVKLGLMLILRVDLRPPARQALRFRAHMWVQDPCKVFDIPVLQSSGRGYLVGLTLNVDCPRPQWWGEGDHKIWLGDEAFPSIAGTSTQGLFGNVRGLIPAERALHGATLVNRVGKNSVYRWFVPDAVAFQDGIAVALENWQYDKARDVYYAVTAFWYAQPNAQTSYEPLSREKLEVPGLRIPGAVEIEGHITTPDFGSVYRQKYVRGVELSGRAAARIKGQKKVEVELPWSQPGRYLLKLRSVPGRSFGTIVVRTADGREVGTVQYTRRRDGIYRVGELEISEPVTVLTIECSRTTILDCWILEALDK